MNKTFQLNIPISKIDEEQRIVTGIATSEALDSQGDIVDYEASKKAFSEWVGIGNIREMHEPIAVGKAIDVQFDDKNKQIIVSAKISKSTDGENTWTKIKEEILTGFSIGGKIFEIAKDKAVEGANRVIDYALSELSLVDNPACPEAKLLMVKSVDGKLKEMDKDEMNKSVYHAQDAMSALSQIAYLLMVESNENEPDQIADLKTAFKALQDFVAKEVVEGDDFTDEYGEVMELANKAINLRKEKTMADKEEKKVEKSTAVVAGEERNEVAEVVTTAEENGRPVNDTEERAVEADVPVDTGEEVTVKTEGEETEEVAEVVEEEPKVDSKKKATESVDLVKSFETLMTKLTDGQGAELRKVADLVSDLSAKVEKFSSLEERVKAIEDQPLPTKSKASYLVEKDGSKVEVGVEALLKRQEELIANPADAKPGEMYELSAQLRKASLGERININE